MLLSYTCLFQSNAMQVWSITCILSITCFLASRISNLCTFLCNTGVALQEFQFFFSAQFFTTNHFLLCSGQKQNKNILVCMVRNFVTDKDTEPRLAVSSPDLPPSVRHTVEFCGNKIKIQSQ